MYMYITVGGWVKIFTLQLCTKIVMWSMQLCVAPPPRLGLVLIGIWLGIVSVMLGLCLDNDRFQGLELDWVRLQLGLVYV